MILQVKVKDREGSSTSWYADLGKRDVDRIERKLKQAVDEGLLTSFAVEEVWEQVQVLALTYRSMVNEIDDYLRILKEMPDLPGPVVSPSEIVFEPLRTAAFKALFIQAFKVFPARLEEILAAESWPGFVDFMAAVGRSGRILLQFRHPSEGEEAEIQKWRAEANTEAMLQLLSGAFFGEQAGKPDPGLVLEALSSLEIRTWSEFTHAVLEIALSLYADRTGGQTPLDLAKLPTRMFYEMRPDEDPHQVVQVAQAFGLATPRHFTALLAVFYAAEVTLEDLDRSVGNYALLTEIVNRAPSNPVPGIVFGPAPEFGLRMAGSEETYEEELIARGIPGLRSQRDYDQAWFMWGMPQVMARPEADTMAIFRRNDPDAVVAFVNDSGEIQAIDLRQA